MKLRTKFSGLSSLLVICVVLGLSFSLLVLEKKHLLSQMEKSKKDTIKGLVKVSEESLITGNRISALNYMKELKNVKGLVYAKLVNAKGEILAHTDAERIGGTDPSPETAKALAATGTLIQSYDDDVQGKISDIAEPIFINGKKQSVAEIGFSEKLLHDLARVSLAETEKRIFAVALFSLILGILGASVLAAFITRPIKQMAWASNQIGQGRLDTKIEIKSKDELGDLAQDINIMAVKLKELDEMKQDFVSSVTHEFRSPLHAMSIHFDLFSTGHLGELTEKQRESLTVLKNNAVRLERFVNDLLDVAKMERGKMEIKQEPLEIRPLLDDVIDLLKVNAEKKGIELKLDIPRVLPKAFADPGRTAQVLTNLVTNSIKFTPKGSVTIKARALDKELEFAITDTGMGIPKDQIHRLFSKFEQVKGATQQIDGPKGTGLGLSIVKGIVEGQGGKVWVESELGKGSTFYFTLMKME